jgi:hypothetical protein
MNFHQNTSIKVAFRRAGLVQLVSASSLSHHALGSKPSLCRISVGVRLCFGYSLPQTSLVWEPLALGLSFFYQGRLTDSESVVKLPDEAYYRDALMAPYIFYDMSHSGPALGQGERGGRSRPSMNKGPSSRVLDVVEL